MTLEERTQLGLRLAKAAEIKVRGHYVVPVPGEEWALRNFAAWLEAHVLPVCRERRQWARSRIEQRFHDWCASVWDEHGFTYVSCTGDTIHEALALACCEFLERTAPEPPKRRAKLEFQRGELPLAYAEFEEGVPIQFVTPDGDTFTVTLEPKP